MARYIDADELIAHLHSQAEGRPIAFVTMTQLTSSISFVEKISAADVAPKSEVIDEILSLIDDKIRFEVEMYNGFQSLKNGKTLCQERVNALNDIKLIINHQFRAELKKKYTEGKK